MSFDTESISAEPEISAGSALGPLPTAARYQRIRDRSLEIAGYLAPEDCMVQSMPEASPIRWHLAHTTWFFETFVLKQQTDYQAESDAFERIFNSYYNSVSDQLPRETRGVLSRPTVAEVIDYRRSVDRRMLELLSEGEECPDAAGIIEIGLQHEQQHQELMLADMKHGLFCNPLLPAFADCQLSSNAPVSQQWIDLPAGVYSIGHQGDGFAFDNEAPRHRVFLEAAQLSNRLVTNQEYLDFVQAGGYQTAEHWLSLGWQHVNQQQWRAPLYWIEQEGQWYEYTLVGPRPLALDQPVAHLCYFEADAYARWAAARLPTEAEWEVAASPAWATSRRATDGLCWHPTHGNEPHGFQSLWGTVWQWTSSSYGPYPGYRAAAGARGEYNGKFMCNQYVLRGSSNATPPGHARLSYRNFFPPQARWQFAGIRLARSCG